MKIISNFKDFYDHGMAYGFDENIIYERFQKTIFPPENILLKEGGVLGFCGEFWRVEKIHSKTPDGGGLPELPKWQVEDKIKNGYTEGTLHYDTILKDHISHQYWLKPIENINTYEWDKSSWSKRNYTPWNNWISSVFDENVVPVFYVSDVRDSYETILNPNLLDYGLQRIMDSVEAFQKLSMFIPTLRPQDDFTITDEEMGKSKGFDEYSFRHKNTKNKPKKF